MTPDADTLAFLDALKAAGRPPLWELTVDDIRASIRAASLQLAAPSTGVHDVADRKMPVPGGEIGLRVYTPRLDSADRPFPIVVHLHGAGFVAGDLDTHDSIARFHCQHGDAVVIAVDYRLAPDHPFPAAVDDAYAALEWVVEHARDLGGDARRIAVLGDSAGGNLAAVVCQLAKARNGPRIAFQALVYPVVDFRLGRDLSVPGAVRRWRFLPVESRPRVLPIVLSHRRAAARERSPRLAPPRRSGRTAAGTRRDRRMRSGARRREGVRRSAGGSGRPGRIPLFREHDSRVHVVRRCHPGRGRRAQLRGLASSRSAQRRVEAPSCPGRGERQLPEWRRRGFFRA